MEAEERSAGRVNGGAMSLMSLMSPMSLPARRVARAAAFSADSEGLVATGALAELLDVAALRVLEGLQEALDAGLALEDRGRGRFWMDGAQADALRRGTTPSLAAAWREALRGADELADELADEVTDEVAGEPSGAARAGAREHAGGVDEESSERAARQLVEAARRSRGEGGAVAMAQLEEAVAILSGLPETPARRVLAVRALMESGRLLWIGEGEDHTLAAARLRLEASRTMLDEDAPLAVRVELEALIGWVNYDLGDGEGLRRALVALERASAMLEEAGQDRAAAELLNDRAAVHVRLGEPVEALRLLHRSRAAFSALGDAPVVQIELAETDHLLARLPLSVPAPAGEQEEALESALGHALSAGLAYAELGMHRERARVKETVGRLQCARGELETARDELSEAFRSQRGHGDLLGLARTSAALAEVLGALGSYRESLAMLRHSVALNRAKGAPRGLAYNRRALDALAAAVTDAELREEVAELNLELSEAERRLR